MLYIRVFNEFYLRKQNQNKKNEQITKCDQKTPTPKPWLQWKAELQKWLLFCDVEMQMSLKELYEWGR